MRNFEQTVDFVINKLEEHKTSLGINNIITNDFYNQIPPYIYIQFTPNGDVPRERKQYGSLEITCLIVTEGDPFSLQSQIVTQKVVSKLCRLFINESKSVIDVKPYYLSNDNSIDTTKNALAVTFYLHYDLLDG